MKLRSTIRYIDKKYKEEKTDEIYLQFMLTLLGVIQGLALNYLATKIPVVKNYPPSTSEISNMISFLLCFVIIVRVFQTYFSASLVKIQSKIEVIDLVAIFAVGLVQYWIIDALDKIQTDLNTMYYRILILSLLACALHTLTTYRFLNYDGIILSKEDFHEAKLSEYWNICISANVGIISALAMDQEDIASTNSLSAVMVFLLLCNIWHSLRYTRLST